MMNKYTHHLSVAFVVSLEKFPTISHKNPSPKFVLQIEQGEGCFTGSCNVWNILRFNEYLCVGIDSFHLWIVQVLFR